MAEYRFPFPRDDYQVLDGPRRTGDGYYESVVVDPDGNRIEMRLSRKS
jgi:lactoylglutathione lyase